MKYKVYLETSFVSYLASRLSTDLVTLQRQLSSQRWWEQRRSEFELLVSETVYEECEQGDKQAVENRAAILNEAALLPLTGCDYLLTWNFKHINNAHIKRQAMRIIEEYGYQPTTICTPEELMGSDAQEG